MHCPSLQKKRIIMNFSAIAIIGTLILRGTSATELPSYEAMGFPITPHQISVLGSAKVKEQSPTYENLAKPAGLRPDSKQPR
jgi:hypothetical protein